jgi:hypothetical protein
MKRGPPGKNGAALVPASTAPKIAAVPNGPRKLAISPQSASPVEKRRAPIGRTLASAIRAAKAAGLTVTGFRIDAQSRSITVQTDRPAAPDTAGGGGWDNL